MERTTDVLVFPTKSTAAIPVFCPVQGIRRTETNRLGILAISPHDEGSTDLLDRTSARKVQRPHWTILS